MESEIQDIVAYVPAGTPERQRMCERLCNRVWMREICARIDHRGNEKDSWRDLKWSGKLAAGVPRPSDIPTFKSAGFEQIHTQCERLCTGRDSTLGRGYAQRIEPHQTLTHDARFCATSWHKEANDDARRMEIPAAAPNVEN